jgi:hypothetical protein
MCIVRLMAPLYLGRSDTRIQASLEPWPRFSLHWSRLVGHRKVVNYFAHGGLVKGIRHGHRSAIEPETTQWVPNASESEAMRALLARLRQTEADLTAPKRAHHPLECST